MRLERDALARVRLLHLVVLALGAVLLSPAHALGAKPPPAPDTTITSSPPARTTSTSASFTFTSTITPATFACSLDSSAYTACTSPATYNALSVGKHTFRVRATAGTATDATPASTSWTISVTASATLAAAPSTV